MGSPAVGDPIMGNACFCDRELQGNLPFKTLINLRKSSLDLGEVGDSGHITLLFFNRILLDYTDS